MTKSLQRYFYLFIFGFFTLISSSYATEKSSMDKGPVYDLNALYKKVLERSEMIGISKEDLYQSKLMRRKALGALVPRVNAFGTHTRYSEQKSMPFQPDDHSIWGVEARQSFTLNGKELTAFKVASERIRSSEYELSGVKEANLLGVAGVYYDVIMAMKSVEIAKANLNRLKVHRNAVKTRLRIEEVSKTALYRAESELSEARADLIRFENIHRLLKARLATIAELPHNYTIKMPKISKGNGSGLNLDQLKSGAISKRYEMKALLAEKKAAQKSITVAKGAYWPRFTVSGSYSNQESNPEVEGYRYETLSVSATVNFPLFDGGMRRADVNQYKSFKRQVDLLIRAKSKEIALEVEGAYLDVRNQNSVLSALKDRFKFANENYNAVMRQFKSGLANSVDVMDANTQLVESEQRLAEATFGLELAHLKLERVKGELLDKVMGKLNTKKG